MVASDVEALGHYGLTMILTIDHDCGKFTMAVVGLLTLVWRGDIILLWWAYHDRDQV